MLNLRSAFPIRVLLLGLLLFSSVAYAWECDSNRIPFTHRPSDYYGSGEYFATCPQDDTPIRCYHYHRHWICQKNETFYWDRNRESAARTACGCSLLQGVAPASPAISKEPSTRFHDFPSE
jgi:hypothetical protein